jgi:hypothetical protein
MPKRCEQLSSVKAAPGQRMTGMNTNACLRTVQPGIYDINTAIKLIHILTARYDARSMVSPFHGMRPLKKAS